VREIVRIEETWSANTRVAGEPRRYELWVAKMMSAQTAMSCAAA
jgi:hypothetical protein